MATKLGLPVKPESWESMGHTQLWTGMSVLETAFALVSVQFLYMIGPKRLLENGLIPLENPIAYNVWPARLSVRHKR